MTRNRIARGLAVATAATALTLSMTSSAHAANATLWVNDRGYIKHIDDGDRFEVCDRKADGHGVTGTLRGYDDTGQNVILGRASDGGDGGCGTFFYNVQKYREYLLIIEWHGGEWKQRSLRE
ncbi:hypothetical protein [Streptomyces sp. NPDC048057]|uniref:hypothetical protein n=1 Tax=Streptomyces sp. NPDC048057 TaxID=3155628 RepID=UPI00340C1BC9